MRKNIARILTVVNQKAKESMRAELKKKGGKVPKQLRQKKTRAIRRRLTKKQVRFVDGGCTGQYEATNCCRVLVSAGGGLRGSPIRPLHPAAALSLTRPLPGLWCCCRARPWTRVPLFGWRPAHFAPLAEETRCSCPSTIPVSCVLLF